MKQYGQSIDKKQVDALVSKVLTDQQETKRISEQFILMHFATFVRRLNVKGVLMISSTDGHLCIKSHSRRNFV